MAKINLRERISKNTIDTAILIWSNFPCPIPGQYIGTTPSTTAFRAGIGLTVVALARVYRLE